MKMRRRTGFGVALALAVGMLSLAGCGDDGDDSATATDAPVATEATVDFSPQGEGSSPGEIITRRFVVAQNTCDAEALEALMDPDVVLTIEFGGEETVFTGSADVLAYFEGNWENGCPGAAQDFEIISVEGNTVTTESTSTLPDGTRVRPTSVYEVSDDGPVTAIRFIEGPVVDGDG